MRSNFIDTNTDSKPWYKQFWPWFVFSIPATSVVVSMVYIYFAASTIDTLVVDDYYKAGLAINQELSRIDTATALSVNAHLNFNPNDGLVGLRLSGDFDKAPEALTLQMIHPTLSQKDQIITLTKTAHQYYTAPLKYNVNGNWHLQLSATDDSWLIRNTVSLPSPQPVVLIP